MAGPRTKSALAGLAVLVLTGCETTPPPPQLPSGILGGVAVSAAPAPAAPAAMQSPSTAPAPAAQPVGAGAQQGNWING